ncbi:hypothetical protein scyTo_0012240, partial [Scyliorhinus torazame]|nr:hypothetical protein [Scyliorhinus torazame]
YVWCRGCVLYWSCYRQTEKQAGTATSKIFLRTFVNSNASFKKNSKREFETGEMKAISPIRSVRSCYEAVCCLSDQSLAISRSKNPLEESISLMYDMNDCYCKLKELVPSIPQNKKVSKMEILQHVIDYIFDLQIALENQQQDPANNPASSSSILALQRSELSSEGDSLGFCH